MLFVLINLVTIGWLFFICRKANFSLKRIFRDGFEGQTFAAVYKFYGINTLIMTPFVVCCVMSHNDPGWLLPVYVAVVIIGERIFAYT